MTCYTHMNHQPELGVDVYAAPGSMIIGRVRLGDRASVWFNSVIRGDEGEIVIGNGSNIQDLCVLHTDRGHVLSIGNDVTVGHRCVIHGCVIEDDCLIGMGAVVMNGARIGRGSIVAAGAVVLENTVVPPYSLVAGIPATVKKTLPEETLSGVKHAAETYRHLSVNHREDSEII